MSCERQSIRFAGREKAAVVTTNVAAAPAAGPVAVFQRTRPSGWRVAALGVVRWTLSWKGGIVSAGRHGTRCAVRCMVGLLAGGAVEVFPSKEGSK